MGSVTLKPLPGTFAATRDALHRVAERIVAPARKPHNEIALRQTPGGFGTSPFEFEGRLMQVRVEGSELVLSRDGDEARTRLTSLADAGRLLGPSLLPDGIPADPGPLGIDPMAATRLAELYAFAAELLETFKSGLAVADDASETNLWPEHFDIAFEAGSDAAGQRANYGVSPGDEEHAEPYVYVGPWTAEVEGELWNATGFRGAELGYAYLLAARDQAGAALSFLRSRRAALVG